MPRRNSCSQSFGTSALDRHRSLPSYEPIHIVSATSIWSICMMTYRTYLRLVAVYARCQVSISCTRTLLRVAPPPLTSTPTESPISTPRHTHLHHTTHVRSISLASQYAAETAYHLGILVTESRRTMLRSPHHHAPPFLDVLHRAKIIRINLRVSGFRGRSRGGSPAQAAFDD